jgi:cell division protease FtsH
MSEQQRPKAKSGPARWKRSATYAALIVVMLGVNYWVAQRATAVHRVRVPYSPFFLRQVGEGNVKEITSRGTAIQGRFRHAVAPPTGGGAAAPLFATEIPAFADTNQLSRLLQSKGVSINAVPLDTGVVWWKSLLFGFGPTLLFLLLLFTLIRRVGGPQAMLGAFGRSKARRYLHDGTGVTFADVAGIDEAKLELTEVVDFLKNPDKYQRLGGRIPRGVLLSGPPGTGKTLLAKAVAGEAGAPFFSMSASEFVEAIVGIGASRVRDLFTQAKTAAPAIVFIDELDAIGRARGGPSIGGGSDEREQTLNQILTEMDGFDSSTKVIVLAATNRPDVLDKALLRPGRFDRRVTVQPPDRTGRRLILEVHTRSVPLAPEVDLGRIAATTPGMVGADLANLVNEAALLAARRNRETVFNEDFGDALEKIVLGAERKVMMTDADRRRTAYHEAGHALVGMLMAGADPVRKVSIIPRGPALGVTFSSPDVDRFNFSKEELEARIKVAIGGRTAEEIVFGDQTTGAENDIDQLTLIARHMVGRWGMSAKVGLMAMLPHDGSLYSGIDGFSPRTHELFDDEVRRIIDEAHAEVTALLQEERQRLDALAQALLENETLDELDAYAAAGVLRPIDAGALTLS